ncbi:uncharacterized protein LOC144179264 [Haemaphysalis longicornis]
MNEEVHTTKNSADDYYNGVIEKGVVRLPTDSGQFPNVDFGTFIRNVWSKNGAKTAVIDKHSGEECRYSEMEQRCLNVAAGMQKLGFQPGDVVAFCSDNCLDLSLAFFGAIFAGATLTFAKTNLSAREISHQLVKTKPAVVFCDVRSAPKVKVASREVTSIKAVVVFGQMDGMVAFYDLKNTSCHSFPGCQPRDPDDVLIIFYTSGSTGLPKGALITHKNFISEICNFLHQFPAITDRAVGIVSLPIMHPMGTWLFCFVQIFGAAAVLLATLDVDSLLMAAQEYENSVTVLYPTCIRQIVDRIQRDNIDMKKVRAVLIGGTMIPLKLLGELCAMLPNASVLRGYGLTEASVAVACCRRPCSDAHCVGPPIHLMEIKVVDVETRTTLEPHGLGEICLRGPNCFKGYLDAPEATTQVYDGDGFLRTGDVGYYSEDGHIHVTGRIKDLIKCMDQQVGPAELEELLLSHSDVKEAVVVGVPHKEFGEAARAFVVLRDGRPCDEAQKDCLRTFVKDSVAYHKELHGGIEFMESLPKTETGKVLRRELCEAYAANDVTK